MAQFLRLKSRDATKAIPNLNRLSVYKALGPPFCGFVIRAVAQVYSAGDVAVLPDLKSPVSVLPHRTAPANLDFALSPSASTAVFFRLLEMKTVPSSCSNGLCTKVNRSKGSRKRRAALLVNLTELSTAGFARLVERAGAVAKLGFKAHPHMLRHAIASRLWRLPGQLLLALINATAILVILAAILALVALAHIDHFAQNVAAGMTEAVLSKVDLPSKDVLANLRNLTAEVRALRNTVEEFKAGESPALQFEVAQLKEKLTVLNFSVERLKSARSILTDEAIAQLGRTATDALMKLRNCSSTAGLMTDHYAFGSNTVEAREAAEPQKADHAN